MPSPERPGRGHWRPHRESASRGDPEHPSLLPPELAAFLRDRELACVTHLTDRGTVFVVKAPAREIDAVRGDVPILLQHQLFDHPCAPVIRIVTTIYDQPGRPLALETFINVGDEQQRADYEALAGQTRLYMLFFDEALLHRLTKAVGLTDPDNLRRVLVRADSLLAAVPPERFEFDRAKAEVVGITKL